MTRRVEDHAGWGLKGGEAVAALSLTQFAESQGIIRPIRMTLLELEQAFLVDQRGWGNAGIERRILDAFVRLREVAEVLEAELGRRDNSFRRHRQLRLLREHALWLARRLGHEVFLQVELALEAELKSQISPRAQGVYLRLVEAEALEEEFMGLDDSELGERLVTGVLARTLPVALPDEGSEDQRP